jgi:hypothetical protein
MLMQDFCIDRKPRELPIAAMPGIHGLPLNVFCSQSSKNRIYTFVIKTEL